MFFFTTKSTEKNRTEDTKVLENSALFVWFFSVFSVVKYALDVFFYHKVHGEKPHGGHKKFNRGFSSRMKKRFAKFFLNFYKIPGVTLQQKNNLWRNTFLHRPLKIPPFLLTLFR
jgi:hypothetical protein